VFSLSLKYNEVTKGGISADELTSTNCRFLLLPLCVNATSAKAEPSESRQRAHSKPAAASTDVGIDEVAMALMGDAEDLLDALVGRASHFSGENEIDKRCGVRVRSIEKAVRVTLF